MAYLDNFNYQILGHENDHKLVFLHGLLGSAANWRRITPSFEESHQVLILDQRGHGRSFQPEKGYAPEDFSEDLQLILKELDWKKVDLVGHSMGGRNAVHFAYRHPERVRKLVIEDIGPEGNRESSLKIEKMLGSVPIPFDDKKRAREFFENEFLDKDLGNYLYSNLTKTDDEKYNWRFSLSGVLESLEKGRIKDRWNELGSLKIPTLVVRGERSLDLNPDTFRRMIECNENIEGIEIEDSGHWVHFDQPDDFIRVLREFLLDQ